MKFKSKSKHKADGKVGKSVKKYVKRTLDRRIEHKHFNVIQGLTGVAAMAWSTGVILPLSVIANGTGVSQRLGNSLRPMKLTGKVFVQQGAATPCNCRILIVQDKENVGTNPLLIEVAEPAVTGLGTITAPAVPYNVYFSPARFNVLKDYFFSIDGIERTYHDFSYSISGKKMNNVNYQSAGTLDGKGAIYLIAWSSIDPATNLCPRMYSAHRLEYEDA